MTNTAPTAHPTTGLCDACQWADYAADQAAQGPTCSVCDAPGHGFPGGAPCPLEDAGYDTDGIWR